MKLARLNHWPKRLLLPAFAVLLLTGCFGGTVAQQLARSIFMHGADKATAAAIDAHERQEKLAAQHMVLESKELDTYQIAFLRSGFNVIQPQVETLPQAAEQAEPAVQELQASKLVSVEVWSLLIGDEKQKLLEKASLQGSQLIPPKEEWPTWHVAIGGADEMKTGNRQESIIFLIPPDLGKMHSGNRALVELPHSGELSIARYALN
ncbi:hypothetical protein [Methylotenera sp. G11]|uniref:hypothetical protein n=1 Tax=Methylotenera sp. G11 TaxID=1506585 RepID=UPI0006458165|nr:hypothetical protein [Methylotenera sp. G11]